MKKVLLLLNDTKEYDKLIIDLIESKTNINLLTNYSVGTISQLCNEEYDIIIIEDNNQSEFAVNCLRTTTKSIVIFISNRTQSDMIFNIHEIITKDTFIRTYCTILKQYGLILSNKELNENNNTTNDKTLDTHKTNNYITYNRNKTIFLVDDDEISLSILNNMLKNEGFTIKSFSDGYKMLKSLREMMQNNETVHLIILDLMMPIIDGFHLLKNIREISSFKFIPVLISSSRNDKNAIIEVAKYNISGYILKPYDRSIIIEKINSIYNF